MSRNLNEVVVIDAVRTAFGKAGEKGIYCYLGKSGELTLSSYLVRCRNPRPAGGVMWDWLSSPEWAWLKAHSMLSLLSSCCRNRERKEKSSE